jgi:ribonuclease HII
MKSNQTASLRFERSLWEQGYTCIAGLDEVGRGALAGPVVAGAVCLPAGRDDLSTVLEGVRDSKQLTARARENLIERIQAAASGWGVGEASSEEIDTIGIVPATCLAMERALEAMLNAFPNLQPDYLLLDSIKWRGRKPISLPHQALVKGDSLSLTIAAASVLAKVHRDTLMIAYDQQYPGYEFAVHKGYGVARHHALLREHGASPIHRMTFAPLRQPELL